MLVFDIIFIWKVTFSTFAEEKESFIKPRRGEMNVLHCLEEIIVLEHTRAVIEGEVSK